MTAVIMAGGKGTRMAGICADKPKPMIEISGRPIIYHQIMNLKKAGIFDFILVIGHLGESIRRYFDDGSQFGIHITYYEESKPLGTGGALWQLKSKLAGDFILAFGDVLFDLDWSRFLKFHEEKSADISLFVHPNAHPFDSDILLINQNQVVTGMISKKDDRSGFYYRNTVNAGLYIMNSRSLDLFSFDDKVDLETDIIMPMITMKRKIFAYKSTEYVKDMGTPERLASVTADYTSGRIAGRNLNNQQKCIFLDRDGTINILRGFITSRDKFELEDSVCQAIHLINESGYLCIVATNQPVIARGECSEAELDMIHAKMETLLGQAGCYVDDIYYCPHHPDSGYAGEIKELKIQCDCRKPKLGMIERAARDYHISLKDSWFIGDSTTDIQTGINAGMQTILVQTGEAGQDHKYSVQPAFICDKMLDAVGKILEVEHNAV